MRHRITVQTPTETNELGERVITWTDLIETWAEILPVQGNERFLDHQRYADVTHRVRMRWLAGVTLTPKQRLVFAGRVFEITAVLNVEERNRELIVMCTERHG